MPQFTRNFFENILWVVVGSCGATICPLKKLSESMGDCGPVVADCGRLWEVVGKQESTGKT